jgi:uncharacterized protein (DUF2235 family)
VKRLIVCCDGTWNRADQESEGALCPTNVVKIAFRIAKRDRTIPQIVHYDQGVGTGNRLDRLTGGAFGHGLEDNIHQAYRFLVANYEPGDELFLFGFSRGAFTARSLGGMIRKCGVLTRRAVGRYREALTLYRSGLHPDQDEARRFRDAHSVCGDDKLIIRFLGVWDTVGSLGIPLRGLRLLTRRKYQFHDTELSGTVRHGCHALAIDEYRRPFDPTRWAATPKEGQTVEQVWFCGAHSDVGGGYATSGLSDITLDWMIDRAQSAGLVFDPEVLTAHPLRPDPRGTLHDSKRGLYRFSRRFVRSVGIADTREGRSTGALDASQSLHPSVLARWDAHGTYRPEGLRAYLARINDPRATAP